MSERLGTAQWEAQPIVSKLYPFAPGKFWLGRSEDSSPIGYEDDRHVCLVSGNRGGKGTSVIVNNLCFWPGSAVVIDPKGENATVTAARRGRGSEYCEGMGQVVHVLDPFKTAQVDPAYLSCFNPLADLDPEKDETIDEASRLANAIIVVNDGSNPYWDEAARSMVKGLILHVLTAKLFSDEERNLVTVRKLVQRGAWEIAEAQRQAGHDPSKIDPHLLLWGAMEMNQAFDGIIAGVGTQFRSMMMTAGKQYQGVLQGVATQTEFLDSPGMRRVLSKSDFKLSELKTRPEGMTLYLSLPQRYMDTHSRWLRMMVALTVTEMEMTRSQPASGHPVLMVLDEFAGLKRMTFIENAVAQIAGYGVKLFFVLQSLEQLKYTYKDSWETFLANAGVKIFFSIEDHFTRDYVSQLAGEKEIRIEVQSSNESQAASESYAKGHSQGQTLSHSTTDGLSESQTDGTSFSAGRSSGTSVSHGTNQSTGWSEGASRTPGLFGPRLTGTNSSYSGSSGTNDSTSESQGTSETWGRSNSSTTSVSKSDTTGRSDQSGTSETYTQGQTRTAGKGIGETVHRVRLIPPEDLGREFARRDDRQHPAYPGLALILITGASPLKVRRTHYFQDPQFIDCFAPHPDHKFIPAISRSIVGLPRFINALQQTINGPAPVGLYGNATLSITQWFVRPGTVVVAGQPVIKIDAVAPDRRSVRVYAPSSGRVTKIANDGLASGELLTIKTYTTADEGIDPFIELRAACRDAMERLKPQRVEPPRPAISRAIAPPPQSPAKRWGVWLGVAVFCGLVAAFVVTQVASGGLASDEVIVGMSGHIGLFAIVFIVVASAAFIVCERFDK